MRNQNMKPEDISAALSSAGITQTGIARELGKSQAAVSQVIRGLSVSHNIRLHIAKCIKMPVENIWPETYLVKADPTKKGRPMGRGLYAA